MPLTKPVELLLAGMALGEVGFSVACDDIEVVLPVVKRLFSVEHMIVEDEWYRRSRVV